MSDTPNTPATSSGLPENVASALCYVFGFISGLVFFLIEKTNETVRFHAVQSIILTIGIVIVEIVVAILAFILGLIPVLGGILVLIVSLLVGIAIFALWLGLIITAATNKKIKLPIISDLAEKYSKPAA